MGLVRWILMPCALTACQPVVERAKVAQLQARAAFDLGCPYVELQLLHFDERAKGVTGCGRRLTYVEVCDPIGGVCTWMLDTPTFEQLEWPSSAAVRRSEPPSSAPTVPCGDRWCEQPAATAPSGLPSSPSPLPSPLPSPSPSSSQAPTVNQPRIDRGF